jgi:hypothetical protein
MKFFTNRNNSVLSHDIAVHQDAVQPDDVNSPPAEKQQPNTADDDGASIEAPSEDVQEGIKKVEAVTLTWTKNELIIAYGL